MSQSKTLYAYGLDGEPKKQYVNNLPAILEISEKLTPALADEGYVELHVAVRLMSPETFMLKVMPNQRFTDQYRAEYIGVYVKHHEAIGDLDKLRTQLATTDNPALIQAFDQAYAERVTAHAVMAG